MDAINVLSDGMMDGSFSWWGGGFAQTDSNEADYGQCAAQTAYE